MLTFNEWLFNHHLEFSFFCPAKTKNRQASLREISIVERDAVKSKDRLNKIIKTYRFY